MLKRTLLAVIAVFVAWSVLDFVIHGLILKAEYAATAQLWRPMAAIKFGLLRVVTFIAALAFVAIYAGLLAPKNIAQAVKYGLLYGLATGVGMGYGSYAVMPITYHIALVWFLGCLVHGIVGGLLAGAIIRD